MYEYPVIVTDGGDPDTGYWVVCPDIPEMNSLGDTPEEPLREAEDGLVAALSICVDQAPRHFPSVPSEDWPAPGAPGGPGEADQGFHGKCGGGLAVFRELEQY